MTFFIKGYIIRLRSESGKEGVMGILFGALVNLAVQLGLAVALAVSPADKPADVRQPVAVERAAADPAAATVGGLEVQSP
ncbi:MAG: hypothetical protein HYW91_01645 [Candidatus Sungbacteria bacterium]|nr:hypothetical protein [Candidatus Sungbacteria bacterium]